MRSASGLLLGERRLRVPALLAALTCLGACGSESAPAPASGGVGSASSGAGGANSVGPASGGGLGLGGGTNGGGSGGQQASGGLAPSGGGPADCSTYQDDTGWQLLIEITNSMSQTLHLGPQEMGCDPQLLFEVEDGARTVLPALGTCRSSCQAAMQGTPVSCPLVCPNPTTVTLEPGQSVRLPWDGLFAVPQALPQHCVSGAVPAAPSCVSAQRVEAGVFTFSAHAGTGRRCLDPSGTCACSPNATGGCATPSSLINGTIITTELFILLEPGELGPGGDPPYVGLVFED